MVSDFGRLTATLFRSTCHLIITELSLQRNSLGQLVQYASISKRFLLVQRVDRACIFRGPPRSKEETTCLDERWICMGNYAEGNMK
jgi:hypothetical protein